MMTGDDELAALREQVALASAAAISASDLDHAFELQLARPSKPPSASMPLLPVPLGLLPSPPRTSPTPSRSKRTTSREPSKTVATPWPAALPTPSPPPPFVSPHTTLASRELAAIPEDRWAHDGGYFERPLDLDSSSSARPLFRVLFKGTASDEVGMAEELTQPLQQSSSKYTAADAATLRKCVRCRGSFCIRCKVPWHDRMACYEYKRRHPHARPEDAKLQNLAKQRLWRQCVKCKHMIELAEGRYHMTLLNNNNLLLRLLAIIHVQKHGTEGGIRRRRRSRNRRTSRIRSQRRQVSPLPGDVVADDEVATRCHTTRRPSREYSNSNQSSGARFFRSHRNRARTCGTAAKGRALDYDEQSCLSSRKRTAIYAAPYVIPLLDLCTVYIL